jgi:hypothetical protein
MLCQKCNQREATIIWAAAGIMDYIHGMSQLWCARCVLEEQLRYAEKCAENVDKLKADLKLLRDSEVET